MSIAKKILAMALIATTALSLSACSDEDIAFGAGVVVGVIIGDRHDDHHHRRPNPPRYRRGRRYHSVDTASLLAPAQVVALKYNLTMERAEILTAHLLPAQEGDLSGLRHLGFEKSDLVAMFEGKNPSASTLLTLSEKLDVDKGEANRIIQAMREDVAAAKELMK
jgi:hypothetical protein